eukprot:TRINITY_DN18933_c0_g2_i1.p2 TRINITY_DN18933_c0_g2~~TRINITY_DN18933_c0_g2_i1.p2  ORF type:complete len:108 (+),score=19.81 TRINITY_DN18933_c0_g2_i1:223-546(+)
MRPTRDSPSPPMMSVSAAAKMTSPMLFAAVRSEVSITACMIMRPEAHAPNPANASLPPGKVDASADCRGDMAGRGVDGNADVAPFDLLEKRAQAIRGGNIPYKVVIP